MGTRQEAGILLLILVLALPAAWTLAPAGEDASLEAPVKREVSVCALGVPGASGTACVLLDRAIPVNTARAEDLTVIPGIGPVLANRIVEARERLGMFEDLEGLYQVRGIGPKRLEVIRRYVVVE